MQDDFKNVFHAFEKRIKYLSWRHSSTSGICYEDFFSELSECLWNCYRKFDKDGGAKFDTYVYKAFRMKIVNILKSKENRQWLNTSYFQERDERDSDAATFEIPDDGSERYYDEVLYKKKEPEKQKLIEFFLQSPQTDSITTAIVMNFEKYDGNYTAIGKSLGLHHEKVRRRLHYLSRLYDHQTHGEILDYFPDGVEIKRQHLTA